MKTTTTPALAATILFAALSTLPSHAEVKTLMPSVIPERKIDKLPVDDVNDENRIQIALLLDTSSSMDGLIDQARTQLWKVVNTFIDAERDGKTPFVEVALYEYGNNDNAMANEWIRLVSPLTRDLDKLSRELFALKTDGGDEFCGAVIQRSLGDLAWDKRESTYKAIFIAGNEPFTQGRVDAMSACKEALAKGIIINTIHCGSRQTGISGKWHDGAALAGGEFLVIDQDKKVSHINAPQDKRISDLSLQLNKTYLGYGKQRAIARENQALADRDAIANKANGADVQRAITKISGNYSNANWDLIDAVKEGKINPAELDAADLPEEMKSLAPGERKAFIEKMAAKRTSIKDEIKQLNKDREKHVAAEIAKQTAEGDKTLDQAMIDTTRKQAKDRGYTFTN